MSWVQMVFSDSTYGGNVVVLKKLLLKHLVITYKLLVVNLFATKSEICCSAFSYILPYVFLL